MQKNNDLITEIKKIIKDEILKIVLSAGAGEYRRVDIERKTNHFYVSQYTQKQVFNKNLDPLELEQFLQEICPLFREQHYWTRQFEYTIKVSKKGKVLLQKKKSEGAQIKVTSDNNKQKAYILSSQNPPQVLVDMGVVTADGKVVNSKYGKFKQINRFLELIDDTLRGRDISTLSVLDFGCGKSYLTFLVYHYLTNIKKISANVVGLDLKQDVIENCNSLAQKYGYKNLHFQVGNIFEYQPTGQIDMVIALHACNTATDFALFNAIKWGTKTIFSVPCCQSEVNQQISRPRLKIVADYGIAKERISSLFTDIIRCNMLKSQGYSVDLIDFVDFSATPKNLMIRACKVAMPQSACQKAKEEAQDLMQEFGFSQMLYRLLYDQTLDKKTLVCPKCNH